jgi:hypothetical protein
MIKMCELDLQKKNFIFFYIYEQRKIHHKTLQSETPYCAQFSFLIEKKELLKQNNKINFRVLSRKIYIFFLNITK